MFGCFKMSKSHRLSYIFHENANRYGTRRMRRKQAFLRNDAAIPSTSDDPTMPSVSKDPTRPSARKYADDDLLSPPPVKLRSFSNYATFHSPVLDSSDTSSEEADTIDLEFRTKKEKSHPSLRCGSKEQISSEGSSFEEQMDCPDKDDECNETDINFDEGKVHTTNV
ncbi:uncharacterized protein LOC129752293 [Uranotaenia lowii]|uniref:uncharacterized protein LOC129752293 n=1 Tax=Uranotaenia lowii TaxID=190385 RepID=UPI00247910DB|nr:uncharacterized protein LOC129752293 [Uranotaenia lowii]